MLDEKDNPEWKRRVEEARSRFIELNEREPSTGEMNKIYHEVTSYIEYLKDQSILERNRRVIDYRKLTGK